jgi:hypothetical protein
VHLIGYLYLYRLDIVYPYICGLDEGQPSSNPKCGLGRLDNVIPGQTAIPGEPPPSVSYIKWHFLGLRYLNYNYLCYYLSKISRIYII